MKRRTVFFCGDQSPYGRAHLAPVFEAFDVAAVVIGAPARWAAFRRALSGGEVAASPSVAARVRRMINRYRRGYIDVPKVVRSRGVPLIVADDVNAADTLARVRALGPDVLVSAAYPQIFGKELLAAAPGGAVNFHPSLLPRFRGAHPHFWAIATGEETGGVTAHFMTPRIDDGDVVAQRAFPIGDLTYSQLYRRINAETPALVRDVAAFFADSGAAATPQDESRVTVFRNDRELHRRIFWNLHPAAQVRNLCRTERAFCFFRGRPITPLGATVVGGNRNLTNGVLVDSGTLVDIADDAGVVVKATDACVAFREVSVGGCPVDARRWARRQGARVGERFD